VYRERDPGCIEMFRCEIGKARRQFEEGLALLRVTFPETDFELGEEPHPEPFGRMKLRGVVGFRELLAGLKEGHVEMPLCYWSDFLAGFIDPFFMHAIAGFTDPGREVTLTAYDTALGLRMPKGMPIPGVMTWGDFLRVLTLFQVGIVLRKAGADGKVEAPRCLFTREEYERECWMLAGMG